MDSVSGVTILVAVGSACVAAALGWFVGARRAHRAQPVVAPTRKWRLVVTGIVVLGAIGAALVAPIVCVFWILVASNFILGQGENIPFSTYNMFSQPRDTAWALHFEDDAGEFVPIGLMGINPVDMWKRFASELDDAYRSGITDRRVAQRRAAEAIAIHLEQCRPESGRWSTTPIKIVLLEYFLQSGRITASQTLLAETTPS
jgi:hypothetical protein